MIKTGPIILLDDDPEDLEICIEVLREIGVQSEIITLHSCGDAYNFLMNESGEVPFIIISDINLPQIDGIELKKMIDENPVLCKKSIPFVFYSTSGNKSFVNRAFEHKVQGFFTKENSYAEIKSTFQMIFDYWLKSKHPRPD